MTESKLQHEIVMWYSQQYPQLHGSLFEVNNNPKNQAHGSYRKSMGMIKSVSDLILHVNGRMAGIECKAPGSTHSVKHIKSQIEWGKGVIERGGYYFMSSDEEDIKMFIGDLVNRHFEMAGITQGYIIKEIEQQMENGKTIKF